MAQGMRLAVPFLAAAKRSAANSDTHSATHNQRPTTIATAKGRFPGYTVAADNWQLRSGKCVILSLSWEGRRKLLYSHPRVKVSVLVSRLVPVLWAGREPCPTALSPTGPCHVRCAVSAVGAKGQGAAHLDSCYCYRSPLIAWPLQLLERQRARGFAAAAGQGWGTRCESSLPQVPNPGSL